jgi:alanine racemase
VLRLGDIKSSRFRRDAWLEVNLSNLEFNVKQLYSEFQKPLIPVLKADAYGHGANVLVELLDSYDFIYAYAVASIDEALNLREVTKKKIMVLGITPLWALENAVAKNVDVTIADLETARELNQVALKLTKKAKIHLKIDSGMNRIGFKVSEKSKQEFFEIIKFDNLQVETAFTHMASPHDHDFSYEQEKLFFELMKDFDFKIHPASSIAARNCKNKDFDFVRVGIELYGLDNVSLKPLLSLYSRISFVKDIKQGETVSYGRTWKASKGTRIITLPLGYADGVHRLMSNKIKACYKNKLISQVGTITMDQMMFDVGDLDAKPGDLVELFGERLSIDFWAQAAETINYEIATSLNLRLPKTYTR